MQTILLHLQRLKRHYDASVQNYDQVSLLDLSHTLRIWADLKPALQNQAPAFRTTLAFKTAIPARKILKAARKSRFVFAYMPGGVITHASNGHVASMPEFSESSDPLTIGASFKINSDGSMELKNYCIVYPALEDTLIKAITAENVKRCNYIDWMGAEAVRLSYPTQEGLLKPLTISREILIRRVANTLDGSHPSAAGNASNAENRFDPAIHHLLQYEMGGLPLPYFILLKISQDILAIAPKLLRSTPSEGAY